MKLVEINQDRCIRCSICTKVCPVNILKMEESGISAVAPEACIACGHCVAVCPEAAIDNGKAPLVNQSALDVYPVIPQETAEKFLRARRSVRCYKDAPVSREKLLQLVETGRYASTASNRQGVAYMVVENRKLLRDVSRVVVEWMEGLDPSSHWSFAHHIRAYREQQQDTILRDAPHLILGLTEKNFARGRENTIFSLAYLELYATSLGLGSCWAGLLEMCITAEYAPLLRLFDTPADRQITGAIMVGYPRYQYKRLVDRNSLEIMWK